MAMNDSNKMPYLLAAGAIGGALGYLFLTKSGQRVRDSVFNMETGSPIPEKIHDVGCFIEKRGKDVGNKLKDVVDRVKHSFDEGKRVYEEGTVDFRHRMDTLDRNGKQVVSNIHRAIDDLNRTLHSVEESILEPLYQAGAMVKAVDSGVRKLVRASTPPRMEERTLDSGPGTAATFFRDQQRISRG